ncbi:YbaN family protein [Albidovulum sediminicola]|uniref:YbaN family protein n=1 Tax=Albidovulum sediminicola TaxID=2984331 RepID=A0ABT2YWS6_9RHOB|nr:YbaN family protein [Defluviimonas sp. WL0075]MCV2863285.1 YbaN family protein [Defluviimonas sp. WL0075]
MRPLWVSAGLLSLGLGLLGLFLPLLPTVPFLLLSAFCFARSSERLHDWLVNHDRLGPPIRDWRERGAVSRRAKLFATASVLASLGLAVWLGFGTVVLLVQVAALSGVMAFLWTRPDA